jgi:hypothetical protein
MTLKAVNDFKRLYESDATLAFSKVYWDAQV